MAIRLGRELDRPGTSDVFQLRIRERKSKIRRWFILDMLEQGTIVERG